MYSGAEPPPAWLETGRMGRAEQRAARRLRPRVRWAELLVRHGDWGRDGAMYFAVRHGGQRLAEVVGQIPGLRYPAAAQAVKRFGAALEQEADRQRFMKKLQRYMSTV